VTLLLTDAGLYTCGNGLGAVQRLYTGPYNGIALLCGNAV